MNITELMSQYRREARDEATVDPLTSEATLIFLYNQAVDEACKRKKLLFDSTTEAVCQITVVDGTATYAIHEAIVFIDKAYLVNAAGTYTYLGIFDRDKLDRDFPTWRESTGSAVAMIIDETSVQLVAEPNEDATLYLEVYRTPLTAEKMIAVVDGATALSPAIASAHHDQLYHWPLSIVYRQDDANTYAPEKAAYHEGKFIEYFGEKIDARRLRQTKVNKRQIFNRWW